MPNALPISDSQAQRATQWLIEHYREPLSSACAGKAYDVPHLCAIVCQETAYRWLGWIERHEPATVLARCVLDASGDAPNSTRRAFPVNAAAFRAHFGDEFTELLIGEANMMRALMGWSPRTWLYKGYGIFQYDLQFSKLDPVFFREKHWYDFEACLTKVTWELDRKLDAQSGDLWEAIRAYNGSGAAAHRYRENVRHYTAICTAVIDGRSG